MSGVPVDRIHKRRRIDDSDDESVLPKKSKRGEVTSLNKSNIKGTSLEQPKDSISSSGDVESERNERYANLDGNGGLGNGNNNINRDFRAGGHETKDNYGKYGEGNAKSGYEGARTGKDSDVQGPDDLARFYKAKAEALEKANQRARAELRQAWNGLAEARAERDYYKLQLQEAETAPSEPKKRSKGKKTSAPQREAFRTSELREMINDGIKHFRGYEEIKMVADKSLLSPEEAMRALLDSGYKGRRSQDGAGGSSEPKEPAGGQSR